MTDIRKLREDIDSIDRELLRLFGERHERELQVAAYKVERALPVRDAKREKEMLARYRELGKKYGVSEPDITLLFSRILDRSRARQANYLLLAKQLRPKKLVYREKKLKTKLPLIEIFARLKAKYDTCFLLESLGEYSDFSRVSYIGFKPFAHITGNAGELTVNGEKHAVRNPYEALKEFLPKLPKGKGFMGGLFGYLTYEATRFFESGVEFGKKEGWHDFEFGLYYDGLLFDKKTGVLTYFYLDKDRSIEVQRVLDGAASVEKKFKVKALGQTVSKRDFMEKVKRGLEEIRAGNTFQYQQGFAYEYRFTGDALAFYRKLCEVNPSPHMFYQKFGERELIGSSPELIVRVEGGMVENFPLAGTRKRGETPEEDALLAEKLLADEKERAEHSMLVDLARNDLGRVCEFGTVQARKSFVIKKFGHVQHIASEIVGKLRADKTAFDALATQMPVGTVSGAPKVETMKIIRKLEDSPRGPYAGALGFFSLSGDCVFAAILRSLYAYKGQATIQASAGIVLDSVPEYEYGEVEKKTLSLRKAIEEAGK